MTARGVGGLAPGRPDARMKLRGSPMAEVRCNADRQPMVCIPSTVTVGAIAFASKMGTPPSGVEVIMPVWGLAF